MKQKGTGASGRGTRACGTALMALVVAATMTGCAGAPADGSATDAVPLGLSAAAGIQTASAETVVIEAQADQADASGQDVASESQGSASEQAAAGPATPANMVSGGAVDTADLFTDRDLRQEADLADAVYLSVADGQTIDVVEEGVYVIGGSATNVTVRVAADSSAKVQLVLDGVSIVNDSAPAIYVVSADKVFVTTTATENALSVTGTFVADGETNVDAVIFSKDDLVLNGVGALSIASTANGVSCKDDLKVTGGSYVVDCVADALEANDSIAVADGSFVINAQKDGLHAENDEDDSVGYVYVCGGSFAIGAGGDGIQGTTAVQIDGGSFEISSSEGIEATYVQINGGQVHVCATDDGINASYKSSLYSPTIEINGGDLAVEMGQGDTDAIDSNGSIYVNGGTVSIWASSAFDYDYYAEMNGGTVTVNGEQVTSIQNSMMGPGGGMMGGEQMGMGGPGGQMGGRGW